LDGRGSAARTWRSTGPRRHGGELLGNFTINQYCGLRVAGKTADVHYVVVFGQLPALRELHLADADGDGVTSQTERDTYVGTLAPRFAEGLELKVDGATVPCTRRIGAAPCRTNKGILAARRCGFFR